MAGRAHPRELVGRSDYEMTWAESADDYRAVDKALLASGEPSLNKEESLPDGAGGQHVVLTSKVPMRNEVGEVIGVLGILFDITERKRMELELTRAREAAEEAARAKSAFLAVVSHELRTPLTLILGPVKQALENDGLPADTRVLLERVQRNALRLYGLVNDVLDFTKADAAQLQVHREDFDAGNMKHRGLVDDMQPLGENPEGGPPLRVLRARARREARPQARREVPPQPGR